MNIRTRMALLHTARLLRAGGLVAHNCATVPGVAAYPKSRRAVVRLQRFKGRKGPFLLLADCRRTAARWARYFTPALRLAMRRDWPGTTTLVFAGRPGLPAVCYQRGNIAVRVDAHPITRRLARSAGGLLMSSSLNRRRGPVAKPSRRLRWRWHRHLVACLVGRGGSGRPSRLLLIRGRMSKHFR